MKELPKWDDISDKHKDLLNTYCYSFGLKDGTRLTEDNFGDAQAHMLAYEMFLVSRIAIERAILSKKEGK